MYPMKPSVLALAAFFFASFASASAPAPVCSAPGPDSAGAFQIIIHGGASTLASYLRAHLVAKTALNEKCETMYLAAIRAHNDSARAHLDAIAFGPRSPDEVNARNDRDLDGSTSAYEYALKVGDLDAVRDLKKRGGAVDADPSGTTELILAASWNTKEVVDSILGTKCDVNAADADHRTALDYAILRGAYDIYSSLIAFGARLNTGAVHTPLMEAAISQSLPIVQDLIARKVDVNAAVKDGLTALMVAAESGTPSIVEALIRAGSDINHADSRKYTALIYAVRHSPEMTSLLIRAGADVDGQDTDYGLSPLCWASWYGQADVVALLLRSGADIGKSCKDGSTALHYAAVANSKAVAVVLLSAGVDKCVENGSYETAYAVARRVNASADLIAMLMCP